MKKILILIMTFIVGISSVYASDFDLFSDVEYNSDIYIDNLSKYSSYIIPHDVPLGEVPLFGDDVLLLDDDVLLLDDDILLLDEDYYFDEVLHGLECMCDICNPWIVLDNFDVQPYSAIATVGSVLKWGYAAYQTAGSVKALASGLSQIINTPDDMKLASFGMNFGMANYNYMDTVTLGDIANFSNKPVARVEEVIQDMANTGTFTKEHREVLSPFYQHALNVVNADSNLYGNPRLIPYTKHTNSGTSLYSPYNLTSNFISPSVWLPTFIMSCASNDIDFFNMVYFGSSSSSTAKAVDGAFMSTNRNNNPRTYGAFTDKSVTNFSNCGDIFNRVSFLGNDSVPDGYLASYMTSEPFLLAGPASVSGNIVGKVISGNRFGISSHSSSSYVSSIYWDSAYSFNPYDLLTGVTVPLSISPSREYVLPLDVPFTGDVNSHATIIEYNPTMVYDDVIDISDEKFDDDEIIVPGIPDVPDVPDGFFENIDVVLGNVGSWIGSYWDKFSDIMSDVFNIDWSWWNWLKNWVVTFWDNFTSVLSDVFIPSPNFFNERFTSTKNIFTNRFGFDNETGMLDWLKSIQASQLDFTGEYMGQTVTYFTFSIWDEYKNTFYGLLRGLFFILLILFNYKMAMHIIRGTSMVNSEGNKYTIEVERK